MATKRKINVKPAPGGPAVQPKPVARAIKVKASANEAKKAVVSAPASKSPVVRGEAGLARTAQTISEGKYPFATVSTRDEAYCAMLVDCGAAKSPVALSDIAAKYAQNPFAQSASRRSDDAGVMIRLNKAGLAEWNETARSVKLTDKGRQIGNLYLSRTGSK